MKPLVNPLAHDLDHILAHTQGLWDELRNQRIFITGGTGFFGCWLLESFAWANDKLDLNAQAVVLTRHPDAFTRKAPHLTTHPAVTLHRGDARDFTFPEGTFSHVVHAATQEPENQAGNALAPANLFDANVEGTRHTLEFAAQAGTRKFLFASSGAVYGRQPSEMAHVSEDFTGAPDPMNPKSAYGMSKRASEFLCNSYANQYGFEAKIARCFAFVGPYLPLDAHFAVGNFIRDALASGPININGDGTPFRSYLYAADLAVWLWTIMLRGAPNKPYNVGSSSEISIADLAQEVRRVVRPASEIQIMQQRNSRQLPERYVPSVQRAQAELGLQSWISIDESIKRTAEWYRSQLL